MYIYMIVNRATGKYYIGKTAQTKLDTRFNQHIHHACKQNKCGRLYDAIRENGRDNFTIHVLASVSSQAELRRWEREFIELFRADDPATGYNVVAGGGGCAAKPSTEIKNQSAQALAKSRWSKIPKDQRSAIVPHNGGRPRRYPPCERYGAHRFTNDRCPCGYVRESL